MKVCLLFMHTVQYMYMWALPSVLHQSIFQCCRGPSAIWSDRWPFGFSLIFCLCLQTRCCFRSSHLFFPPPVSSLGVISYIFLLIIQALLPCFNISSAPFFPLLLPPLKATHETVLCHLIYICVIWCDLRPLLHHLLHWAIRWASSALWRSSHLPPGSQSAPRKGRCV